MSRDAYVPYSPLYTLKAFAEDVWIVDGPEIDFRYVGVNLPFPTRKTIVRLAGGELWVHSPIAWSNDLGSAVAELGPVDLRCRLRRRCPHAACLLLRRGHRPPSQRR